METATIEDLAYFMKKAKTNNRSPIFFLGAGASRTGGIPLANEIAANILAEHSDNPRINKLKVEDKTYAKLMNCLDPHERNELLKGYVNDSKINVTHIYLAQLMTESFADYVLTVNFDNLMLKALALFNEFPSTYDMAILNDLTTSTFKEKSVVYLHGQHHGLWLLNTEQEMAKVHRLVPKILDSIKDGRPWVFVGYSGNDPIFEHIKGLGRFDNGLYWVAFNDEKPSDEVCQGLLEKSHSNAFVIEGYDADAFMLKLNSALGLPEPTIIDKPFTSVRAMLDNIVDIDDQDHFKGVKQRLEIVKGQVDEAILQFEQGKVEAAGKTQTKAESDLLQKEIIDMLIKEDYQADKIQRIAANAAGLNDAGVNNSLADLFINWGIDQGELAQTQTGGEAEALFRQAFDKFQKAVELNPDDHLAYYNWGTCLGELAQTQTGGEAEALFRQAFDKLQKAVELNPDYSPAYNNWGNALGKLAQTQTGGEAEALFRQASDKFQKAVELKPDDQLAYFNWGTYLGKLAETQTGGEAEALFRQASDKFQKAVDLKPNDHQTYSNWGNALGKLAQTQTGGEAEALFRQAFDKFQKAVELNPDYSLAYNNWGTYLGKLAQTQAGSEAEALFRQAFDKFQKAVELKPDDHLAYFNWGTYLGKRAETQTGGEAEALFRQAFDKFQKAIELKPDDHLAYFNWGTDLLNLAKTKKDAEAEALYLQALDKCQKAAELGGSCYNLACTYALMRDKDNALLYLTRSLENKQIETGFVTGDTDWTGFLDDEDFKTVIDRYSK
jgi:tetratricopeptide (TPR) repeat protein